MNRMEEPLGVLRGVGPRTEERYAAAGIRTLEDLVTYFPRRYECFEEPKTDMSEAADGQVIAVRGFLADRPVNSFGGGFKRTSGVIRPAGAAGSTQIRVVWFNMPYLKNTLVPGKPYVFRGIARGQGKTFRLSQPSVHTPEDYEKLRQSLQPVYPLGGGLREKELRRLIARALEPDDLEAEFLPRELLEETGLAGEDEALRGIHFPGSEEEMRRARARLVFDEFLLFALGIRQLKKARSRACRDDTMPLDSWPRRALAALPYALTGAQERAWEQVRGDLERRQVMARLIQGDVGSGKTVVAFLALIKAAENGGQGAMMVPTEVLARQHYDAFTALCRSASLPIRAGLLTGSMGSAEKRQVRERLSSGEIGVIIGTHALITEQVQYRNLVLAVTDEQHRFGVRQRKALDFKGAEPHVLAMSATPIPRTLAVILYGDLDVSVIDELPAGRIPVKTTVVDPGWRPRVFAFMLRQIREGHQAYVICPMVEESGEPEASGATEYAQALRRTLPPGVQVALLHGKMRPAEKNDVMERFAAGQIQVLVSTTVVEVGVNVPNATVMVVEDAQRFGLAQLHQLRGRVGRGRDQAYCVLIDTSPGEKGRERLEILKHSLDGFEIAGKDLRLRGPGDLFGIRQSGLMDFRLGDIYQDAPLLQTAARAADRIIGEDAGLSLEKHRLLREKLQSSMSGDPTQIAI